MIEYMKPTDSIFDSGAEALVCPVNCVGIMGAGLAKEFKKRYPYYAKSYQKNCFDGVLSRPGQLHTFQIQGGWLISAATKFHWREKSDLLCVMRAIVNLFVFTLHNKLSSIAIPALGCGLGGLDWNDVRPLIEEAFKDLPDVRVMLYPPKEEQFVHKELSEL